MGEPLPLRKAIARINDGAIRIPGFQRKFVWTPAQAALLMDSIYKGYPFGSILLWRTRHTLRTEKELGGFDLPAPEKDFPVDYVLDGQQRLTSIFATFQTDLPVPAEDPEVWLPVYYDFDTPEDVQESRFIALQAAEVDPERHFPLRTFFDPVTFSNAMGGLMDDRKKEIVEVQQRFQETFVPVETFEAEDRDRVAIVFERVNRMGVKLDIFQLLTAWTWSEEFDLQDRFSDLAEEFSDFGFGDVGEDNDLMLRCCAAILKGESSPSSLMNINGAEVRDNFEIVEDALRRAIDFLRTNLQVRHIKFLPYSAQLIPLAAYFAHNSHKSIPVGHLEVLKRWFWRSCFGHRYSGNPTRNIQVDVTEAIALQKEGRSALDKIAASVDKEFFLSNTFNSRTVATKTLVLLLANNNPLTFLSGEVVKLDKVLAEPNRSEYHHCMPKAWVKKNHKSVPESLVNSLSNFAIISRAENREIRAKAPSIYRADMSTPDAVSRQAFLPDSLWADEVKKFFGERAGLLAARAADLIA